jgi:hypothetical protein
MKQLPEYWYVLYKNEDEFNEINEWKGDDWEWYPESNRYGLANMPGTHWFDIQSESDKHEVNKHKAIQLTFEEWQILVCGKTPISAKTDLTKLLHILKFINNYGNNTNKT